VRGPSKTTPVLDRAQLEMIKRFEDPAAAQTTATLIATFVSEATAGVQRIAAAITTGEPDTLTFEAHSLKGAAATFGLPRLAATADALEHAGKEHRFRDARRLVKHLHRELADGLEALEEASATDPGGGPGR
jgi:HPt (histidine-containing phosphotransfer) domain-containing protein